MRLIDRILKFVAALALRPVADALNGHAPRYAVEHPVLRGMPFSALMLDGRVGH